MDGSSSDRCGYTWPDDHEIEDDPNQQSCCYRQTFVDSDRCVWHAEADIEDEKAVTILDQARTDAEARSKTKPVGELLDGANLSGLDLAEPVTFHRVNLRDADLAGATLKKATYLEQTSEKLIYLMLIFRRSI